MKQKKVLKNELEALSGEFKTIKSIAMSCKAKSVLEKVMWAIVGIIGVIWVIYFIIEIIKDHNPKIAWVKDTNIRELKYPAISICSEITTKIDVAERIGNYFNGDIEIVDEWKELRRKLLEKVFSSEVLVIQRNVHGIYLKNRGQHIVRYEIFLEMLLSR